MPIPPETIHEDYEENCAYSEYLPVFLYPEIIPFCRFSVYRIGIYLLCIIFSVVLDRPS